MQRVRERWGMRRTAVVNQIRGFLLARGLTLPKGRRYLEQAWPEILAEEDSTFSGPFRRLLEEMKLELEQRHVRLTRMNHGIEPQARQQESGERLTPIAGMGPVSATALVAAIGKGAAFRKGRELAAWIGRVPREHSTGGKQTWLGISKRGHGYLRRLFVQGARVVLPQRKTQASRLQNWLTQLSARTHQSVGVVALAHKLARMMWAVLVKQERYRAPELTFSSSMLRMRS